MREIKKSGKGKRGKMEGDKKRRDSNLKVWKQKRKLERWFSRPNGK